MRGRDLSGEIRAEILRNFPPGMSKMVLWRPNWCQKGAFLGPLGFRARLAHPNQPTNQPFIFFHHHQPCVAIMCLSQGPIWPIFSSSSSAMCGHHVSQFGLISFILIRFSKQWFYLGEPPHAPDSTGHTGGNMENRAKPAKIGGQGHPFGRIFIVFCDFW